MTQEELRKLQMRVDEHNDIQMKEDWVKECGLIDLHEEKVFKVRIIQEVSTEEMFVTAKSESEARNQNISFHLHRKQ